MELERFLELQKPDGGCINWIGAIGKGGYGNLKHDNRYLNAHRFAWLILKGNIPKGLHVLHRCDNKRCVNIYHLFLLAGEYGVSKSVIDAILQRKTWN